MTDDPSDAAVERFLDRAESALDSYDQGYADADATLATLRTHVDELSASVEESATGGSEDDGSDEESDSDA
jgi:predicted lipid-binding transport protein (Tim44 family)